MTDFVHANVHVCREFFILLETFGDWPLFFCIFANMTNHFS